MSNHQHEQQSPAANPWVSFQNALLPLDVRAVARAAEFIRLFESGADTIWPERSELQESRRAIREHFESIAGFALTSGLASLAPSASVMLLEDNWGFPHHSCLYHAAKDLALDASGLHTLQHVEDYWIQKVAAENPRLNLTLSWRQVDVRELWLHGRFNDKHPEEVLSDFGRML